MFSNSSPTLEEGGDGERCNRFYFDPEANSKANYNYSVSDEELIVQMKSLLESQEKDIEKNSIQKLYVYQYPGGRIWGLKNLNPQQFVVFKTNDSYWSIEKNRDGITVQSAKELAHVKDRYRRQDRQTPIEMKEVDDGKRSLSELFQYLELKKEFNRPYSYWTDNSKHFVQRIFNEIAYSKYI